MKKFCSFILLFVLCCSLAACAKSPLQSGDDPRPNLSDSGDKSGYVSVPVTPPNGTTDIAPLWDRFAYTVEDIYTPYITFEVDGLWGVMTRDLEVVYEPASTTPARIIGQGLILVDDFTLNGPLDIGNGYTIQYIGTSFHPFTVYCDIETGDIYYEDVGDDTSPHTYVPLAEYNGSRPLPDIVRFAYAQWGFDDYYGVDTYIPTAQYGFCDRLGNVLSAERYDYADVFRSGAAAVMKDGKWAYLDKTLSYITGFEYAPCYGIFYYSEGSIDPYFAYPYWGDCVSVCNMSGSFGVLDKSGNTVVPFEYDKLVPTDEGLFLAFNGNSWEQLTLQ